MDPLSLILLLAAAGAVLIVGELLLPTHGILGFAGLFCLAGAIAVCFYLNRWAGLIIFAAAIVASPFIFNLSVNLWAKSPIGKRVILQPLNESRAPSPVRIGLVGRAVTELRPMGECDFGDHRVEAISELGIIPAGKQVKIIAMDNGRPTVRAVDSVNTLIETGKETS